VKKDRGEGLLLFPPQSCF